MAKQTTRRSPVASFRTNDNFMNSSNRKRRLQRQIVLYKFIYGRTFIYSVLFLANLIFVLAIIRTQFTHGLPSRLRLEISTPRMAFPPLRAPARIRHVLANQIMTHVGYVAKPNVVGVYFANQSSSSYIGVEVLPDYLQRRLRRNILPVSKEDLHAQLDLLNSIDYNEDGLAEVFEDNTCKARYKWMYNAYPTCNVFHELDLTDLKGKHLQQMKISIMSSGFWRDVWKIHADNTDRVILKTLRFNHGFDQRNYDRHRRDALASERLTWSPHIINIYGFCGNSGVYEFAPGGDIEDMLFYSDAVKWNSTELLVVAFQIASAITDTHDSERTGIAALAHTDITPSQFVHVDGIYKLNDFNRCRFIPFDKRRQRNCGFLVSNNPGVFRAPEEYAYELENEKIDIYSMGNVFYVLLTRLWPFDKDELEDAQIKVQNGHRPEIPAHFEASNDPAYKALLKLMAMCWQQDPFQRPTALEVKNYLENELRNLGVQN